MPTSLLSGRSRCLLFALSTLTALQGCGSSGRLKDFSVAIGRDCENLARPVPHASLRNGEGMDEALAREGVQLEVANDTIGASNACQAAQRERLAGAK